MPRPQYALILLALLLGLATACSSSPDIPDKDDEIKRLDYDSVGENGEDKNSNAEGSASVAEGGATTTNGGATAGAGGKLPKAIGPVAMVDGEPIPAKKFNIEVQRLSSQAGTIPPQYYARLKTAIVDRLVTKHLLERAVDKAKVKVSDKEVDAKLQEVEDELSVASKMSKGRIGNLDEMKKKMGLSDKELRASIEQSIALEKLLVKRGMVLPTDDKLKAFYEANKSKLTQPPKLHARHILIKPEDTSSDDAWAKAKTKAKKIHGLVTAKNADFAELAKKHSEDPGSATNGGDLGYFARADMVDAFAKAAFDLQNGQISDPVKTPYGYHIIKTIDRKDAEVVPFEEVKDKLKKQLTAQIMQQELAGFMKELRDASKIVIKKENIK